MSNRNSITEEFFDTLERKTQIIDLGSIFKTSAPEDQLLPDCNLASNGIFALELVGGEYGPENPLQIHKLPSIIVSIPSCNQPASAEAIPIHSRDRSLADIKAFEVYHKDGEKIEESQLKDDWAYTVDNSHAPTFFQREPGKLPQLSESTSLCQRCESVRTISSGSETSFGTLKLDAYY
ncbi:hypothetical protein BHE90_003218 [Fusarium euwallaceae]|uniref:Uncharacterized protein n=1 Tax=Fusarium euwallaceae TaxID=1147111 RepID=A0A430M2W3_9HYPO|nr:hypothetical protein BHE90_003218 [Fusarium euwallaceae]